MSVADTLPSPAPARRKWPQRLLIAVGILLLAFIAMSALAFFAWVDWESSSADEAEAAFAAMRAELGSPEPYVAMSSDADFSLRRDLEPAAPEEIGRVRALVWVSKEQRLLRVDVPFWFLTFKSGATIGLDEVLNDVAAEVSGRTRVSIEDLRRRGPGLYFDWANAHARLLLWGVPK